MQFTPKPNVRVVHILALTVPANDDITRIAHYVYDIEIRIVDDSWHVQRIFGTFRDNYIVVFCGYEVKANLMVIMLICPKTGDHRLVQESSSGSRRAGNNVNVLKHEPLPLRYRQILVFANRPVANKYYVIVFLSQMIALNALCLSFSNYCLV